MKSNLTSGKLGSQARAPRILKIAPTTRAIRAALAVSASMLALAGSSTALAGTCVASAPNTISCDGAFTSTITYPDVDLTLILGANAPTSVNPGAGNVGVEASWPGVSTVISHADITTAGADGIHQYGSVTATLSNDGSISTDVTALGANAVDISAVGDVSFSNAGLIEAYSDGLYDVTAVNASSSTGSVSIDNQANGVISASAYGGGAIAVNGSGLSIDVNNDGEVHASSTNGSASGIYALALDGGASISNAGTVTAYSLNGESQGVMAMVANGGDAYVMNSGDILVAAYGSADGAVAVSGYYAAAIDNSGNIEATSYAGDAFGAVAVSKYSDVTNSGSITVQGYDTAAGIYALAYNDAAVDNSGTISATAEYGNAAGVYAIAIVGTAGITNSGSIEATSLGGSAAGAYAYSQLGYAAVTNTETGSIDVAADYQAAGVLADGGYGATIENAGSITASGFYAAGAAAYSYAGVASVTNTETGSIHASGYAAYGVYAEGLAAEVTNAGDITVDDSLAAIGIHAYGYSSATVTNAETGSIDATGYASALGISVESYNSAAAHNLGDISAWAQGAGYDSEATGISVLSVLGDASVSNDGSINVTAGTVDYYYGGVGTGEYAIATGILATGYAVYVSNSGDIHATAQGTYGGNATGLHASSTNDVVVETADGSSISATAIGPNAYATGIDVYGSGYVSVTNDGDIHALATGDYGSAVGLQVESLGSVDVSNSGAITSQFSGDYGETTGVLVSSLSGDVAFTNTGTITATDADSAVAVMLNSNYASSLVNEGTITATSSAAGSVAVWTGDSVDDIYNYGTINGAVVTGAGDDYLYNAAGANWNAVGYSDFGDGNDTIYNAGTITMTDAAIYLGSSSGAGGNEFINDGLIRVRGDNLIDMGSGPAVVALVPSLNPYPFYNYGIIDFRDGAPNDTLTIVGDFAGDGEIKVDVSGLHGTSDMLYIDGSVVAGSTNHISAEILDMPSTASSDIPVVYVSGDSVASNFALGTVNYSPSNFLNMAFSLHSAIDATNATADVFSLGIDVTGLSDPGTLGAAIAPGVQSLMNSQVGTWRQRMGVIDRFQDNAVSLWIRYFYDRGTVRPDHVADNFGQGGNFDYDQLNSGVEAGVDFAVSDEFSIGLLAAKSRAKQNLVSPGVGSDKIEADTYGVYATWVSPEGFYVDGSYRWMSFDGTLNSLAGTQKLSGDAKTFNVELGYAWTLSGGLKVEPQFQYTRTKVDSIDVWSSSLADFTAEGGDSSRGRLGVSFRKSFGDADNGILWTPYGAISAVREFDGENSYNINDDFFGHTTVEGTSALVELGVTANRGNLAVWGGVNWQDGGALDSFVGGQLGVRYTFGHAKPAPAPAPAPAAPAPTCADLDDDGDGVNNCDDKCPGSMAGEAVGPDGCPVPVPEPAPEPKPFRG